ncbi:hypothetical protein ACMU_05420 [Actibacterium mucosum KCTC 23349]|uniref:YdhG-like domain-containing protein n=1 Tax=Actibacterium mucosum KCTC 23349 TaxID=1454373 RepID=A0A037ZL92_9RHOB|nr:DUF1801 domain-containing protein [Actibacterium mucosum]KAJ56384.1 hypothetical protein ACMU_05420 [Actibacterium mucosum KCTC 23349]
MTTNKTMPTPVLPADFLNAVDHPRRRADGLTLDQIFREETGFTPVMWGPSIVGYGRYHYVYDSGRQGDFLATGFSPRKSNLSIYIMPGYADFGDILTRLGKHKIGKSCLYINTLDDVDADVLRELIRAGLADLATRWTIHPT